MTPSAPPPPPDLIFQTLTGYQATAALETALDLELFTKIAEGHTDLTDLATQCKADLRGIRSLCSYLVVNGFLTGGSNSFGLSEVAASYLDQNKPSYLGGARKFLGSTELRTSFAALTEAVRNGGAAYSDHGTTSTENPVWVDFARAMEPLIAPVATELAEHITSSGMATAKVLDVAAGHGRFGFEIARLDSSAQIYGLDWPNVLEVAQQNAEAGGFTKRFHRIEGSAFDVDWGTDYDLVLLPNFLHHFDHGGCVKLLQKARAALSPGGAVAVLEIVPNEDRVSPEHPACFSLVMLATTPNGESYTEAEYRQMFADAGFDAVQSAPLMGGQNMALIALHG